MRILILYPFLVHSKVMDAGLIRVYKLVQYLSVRHQVYVACFYSDREKQFLPYVETVRQMCQRMVVLPLPQGPGVTRRIWGFLASSQPNEFMVYHSPEMMAEVTQLVEEEKIDVAHVYYSYMLPYRSSLKCPAVLTADEPLFRHWGSQIPFASLPNKLRLVIKAWKWRRYELEMFRQFDRVFAVTEQEQQILSRLLPDTPVEVSPGSTGTESFFPLENVPEEPNTLVFVGNYQNRANIDAMRWFCSSILPRIRQTVPSVKLYMVGPNLPATFDELIEKGDIVITGYAEFPTGVREWIAKGAVFICPVRVGAGIRGKVLEAMAVGKPVVSTPLGLEGIDASPGEDVLIGSTEEEFAQQVVLLLRNPELGYRIGARARKVAEKYRTDVAFAALEQCYLQLVETRFKRAIEWVEQPTGNGYLGPAPVDTPDVERREGR